MENGKTKEKWEIEWKFYYEGGELWMKHKVSCYKDAASNYNNNDYSKTDAVGNNDDYNDDRDANNDNDFDNNVSCIMMTYSNRDAVGNNDGCNYVRDANSNNDQQNGLL